MHLSIKENLIIGAAFIVIAFVIYGISDKSRQYISSDAEGYYMYLPALTRYGFSDLPVRTTSQYTKIESTGRYYDKYTAGVAVMEAPFYGLTCIYTAFSSQYDADGYSQPFQHAIFLAALFYAVTGLFILYTILRKEYSILISLSSLVCIYLGTNLFYYSYREPGMAHVYAFFLWAILLWQTPKIHTSPTWKNFIILSLIIGLLVFIRPSNAVAAIFILSYNVNGVKERIQFILAHLGKFAILILPFAILTLVQLLLWRHMLGETVFFSYNAEPGFIYLTSPKILNVLFHVHNGLFIYAPILLFSIAGLIFGIEKGKSNFISIGVILFLSTYIFASWWAWWFGGAYGHRCYVDLLPLMVLPLAYLFKEISINRFVSLRIMTLLMCLILVYYSFYMTIAYHSPWDGPGFGWVEYWEIVKKGFF